MGTLHHFREKTEDLGIRIVPTMDGDEFMFDTREPVLCPTSGDDQESGSAASADIVPLHAEK